MQSVFLHQLLKKLLGKEYLNLRCKHRTQIRTLIEINQTYKNYNLLTVLQDSLSLSLSFTDFAASLVSKPQSDPKSNDFLLVPE